MISYSVRKSNDIFAFKEKYLPFSSSFHYFTVPLSGVQSILVHT